MAKGILPKSWVTVTPLSKLLALLLFIALPFIGFHLGMKYQKSQDSLTHTQLASKTYKDPDGLFSFQYPENWRIDLTGKSQDDPYSSDLIKKKKDITIGGKEGKINIYWVETYGGGCDLGYEKIMLKNLSLNTCHTKPQNPSGNESWTQIATRLQKSSGIGVDIEAYADPPAEKNREVVLRILSSLQFNPSE